MCTYVSAAGSACGRDNLNGTDYCVFHYGWDLSAEALKSLPRNALFKEAFGKLLAAGKGDWQGFVFSAGTALTDRVEFPINASGARFESLDLSQTVFHHAVDFSESVFNGATEFRAVKFRGEANFDRCRFNGPVSFLHVIHEGQASFYRAEFSGRTMVRSRFLASANLNETVFRGAVSFAGWRAITGRLDAAEVTVSARAHGVVLGRHPPPVMERFHTLTVDNINRAGRACLRLKHVGQAAAARMRALYHQALRRSSVNYFDAQMFRVFEREGQLQGVIFMQPQQTSFSQVDMSNVYVRGTNFSGVQFLGVNWWQPMLGRNGLKDEIFLRVSPDAPFRSSELPALEETCRNVRVALEESRSFNLASDFYIAEMEAARARGSWVDRNFLSIPAVYRCVSSYGTSVGQALRIFCEIVLLYIGLTLMLQGAEAQSDDVSKAALKAFQLLVFQSEEGATSQTSQGWLNTAFRILGLIQLTLLIFAFRTRIRRS